MCRQDSNVLTVSSGNAIAPSGCPAPRVGPGEFILILDIIDSSHITNSYCSKLQRLFIELWISSIHDARDFNASLWDDGNGLSQGEVVSNCLLFLSTVLLCDKDISGSDF